MRASDVARIVAAAQIDPAYYSLDGARHEALCLMAIGQTWHVFMSERGVRHEERTFASEDDACVYFLERLFALNGRS